MSQKLSYNFKSNGWSLTMILNIEIQKPIENKIIVNWCITGISDGKGVINLEEGKLYTENPVKIKSYEENGNIKIVSVFKIEKFRMLQIKEYLQ